jgi:carboxypeptidase Taq
MLSALHPILIAHFPQLAIDDSKLAIMANHVRPGLIRVEADEVTYNMHILLRTQIEHALLHNEITVADVPSVWRTYMKEYLDVDVISDQQGCLQDVHWSYGSFGYFPTYTIGNLYSASIRAKMSTEIDFDTCLNTLEFGPITSWLREHIHQHGSRYTPADLMKKSQITLNVADYLDYISTKYSRLYHLPAATY